jgi:hypothetical protein
VLVAAVEKTAIYFQNGSFENDTPEANDCLTRIRPKRSKKPKK